MLEFLPAYFIVGVLLVSIPWGSYLYFRDRAPNPYGEPIYKVEFPYYATWSRKTNPTDLPKFIKGDMVTIKKSRDLVLGEGMLIREVLIIEPNDQRSQWVPRVLLKRATNLDAWMYKKLSHFEEGADALEQHNQQQP